jgi:hypothetical protein
LFIIGLGLEHFGQHTFPIAIKRWSILVLAKSLNKAFPIQAVIHIHGRKTEVAHQYQKDKKANKNSF